MWRAFARLPEVIHQYDEDARFSDLRESYSPAEFYEDFVSDAECEYAGISSKPNFAHGDFVAWSELFDDYMDQYQNEICFALRQGTLTAFATELPNVDRLKCEKTFESSIAFEGYNVWLNELDVKPVPKECWISPNINWYESSITLRNRAFVWVHVSVEDMLEKFPPTLPIKNENLTHIGQNFFLAGSAGGEGKSAKTRKGRPSLPWESFHVEVARMFRDEEMPEKKDAAIASLQDWFEFTHGQSVSRSSIGQKLKPYYDVLIRKDR